MPVKFSRLLRAYYASTTTRVRMYSLGWGCRCGDQLKTWIGAIAGDVQRLGFISAYGHRYREQNWVIICANLPSNRNVWSATIRDAHGADLSSSGR